MSFLYSEQQSMSRILLVLVVYNDVERLCRLVLYAIDASDTNNITIEKISRLPLEKHTPSPLLLIPLNFQPESFLLITEQEACLLTADDLSCGNVFYPTRLLPRSFGEFDWSNNKNRCFIYCIRCTSGKVEIENTGEIYWHCAGNVNPIGQTMCVVGTLNVIEHDNDEREGDVLLYAGEGADNEVIAVAIALITLQILDNFAPLTDMNVVRDDGHEDTLIFCSGCDTHGSLRIINHGVETFKLQSSKPDWKGMYRTWSSYSKLSLGSLGERYILLSSLVDTRLLATKG
ncbi:mono-functional DNA-alkylating methyl methanesulfonate N-term-domain-containing protein [Mycotypha africana]|uniref:mono-functional DNA-alkylating methyl methanesulfonate N-term-domain-containing protein n=1 Tax=Mycotypha africana TaxID=64632 RepID=UPI0023000EF4|nr:mono-functional DNA-alkylating methyl methanesulfonate N-term-domain-containing protein [Mycotypha africana]KAI8984376.1 mono-functional DNA-alkylating methyl methanesulfonate N-term-domain-containing protein [Mycotypha africana]